MPKAAKLLGVGVLDLGDMLAAHRRRMEADEMASAKKTGAAKTGSKAAERADAAERARRDAEGRARRLEKARRLILEGIETSDISDRLGIDSHTICSMPEARERHARRLEDERQARAAERAMSSSSKRAWKSFGFSR